jgi:hypothetical protein
MTQRELGMNTTQNSEIDFIASNKPLTTMKAHLKNYPIFSDHLMITTTIDPIHLKQHFQYPVTKTKT